MAHRASRLPRPALLSFSPIMKVLTDDRNITKRSKTREKLRTLKKWQQAHMTSSPSSSTKSMTQRSSSPQPCVTKELNSYGSSLLMQPFGKHLPTEKQATQASCVIVKTLNSPPSWRESSETNPSQATKKTTSLSTNLQQQPSTTGATINTTEIDAQWKQSKYGKPHATISPKILSSPKAGTYLLSTPCTPTIAWQACRISSPPLKLPNPKERSSGRNNSNKETKCLAHGKKSTSSPLLPNMPLSQNASGFTNICLSTKKNNLKHGEISSKEPNPSKNGERLLNKPHSNYYHCLSDEDPLNYTSDNEEIETKTETARTDTPNTKKKPKKRKKKDERKKTDEPSHPSVLTT
jgi:hypothetical protein